MKNSLVGFLVETKSFNPILRTSNSHYFFHQMPFLQSENLSKTRYQFSGLNLASFQFSNQWWWVIVPKKRVEIWTFSTSIQKTGCFTFQSVISDFNIKIIVFQIFLFLKLKYQNLLKKKHIKNINLIFFKTINSLKNTKIN
jgi:hypothetical protein